MPNSSARLIAGTPEFAGRTRPVLGGGARGVSGPLLGLLGLSVALGDHPSGSWGSNGGRSLSGCNVADEGGAEGVRGGGAKLSLGRGKVSARDGVAGGGSGSPDVFRGGPKPPNPFCLRPPPSPLLRFEEEVPGRSLKLPRPLRPAVDGRRSASKGPGVIEFMRSITSNDCFRGVLAASAGPRPLPSSSPPNPPGLFDCGESLAIFGPNNSSGLPAPGREFGVNGDASLCDPLERLIGVNWPCPKYARSGPIVSRAFRKCIRGAVTRTCCGGVQLRGNSGLLLLRRRGRGAKRGQKPPKERGRGRWRSGWRRC